jgi:hypothetical protein
MKKLMLVLMSCMVLFAFTAPNTVDAKPRMGSYKSNKGSFTPSKPQSGVTKSQTPKTDSTNKATAGSTTQKRGFFSGGSLMKGLFIGGLAGMLFGGMFGGMGALGNIFGFLINIMAIFVVIMLIRSVFTYFKNRRKPDTRRY